MVFWKRGAKGDDIREPPTPTSGRPKLKAAFTQELRASVRILEASHETSQEGQSGFPGGSTGASEKSPFPSSGRPQARLSIQQKDELRESVHKMMAKKGWNDFDTTDKQEAKEVKTKGFFGFLGTAAKSPFLSPGQARPRLSIQQKDELRESVHKMMAKKGWNESDNAEESKKPRPSLSQAMAEELRTSFHNREASKTSRRPSLSQAMSDELRSSFRNREAQTVNRREQMKTKLMQQRESRREIYPHSITEEDDPSASEDSDKNEARNWVNSVAPNTSGEPPKLLRPELFDELRKSIHSKSTRNFDRRQQIKERLKKRRESQSVVDASSLHTMESSASFADEVHDEYHKELKNAPERNQEKKKMMKWDLSQHSADTFDDASFSDLGETEHRLDSQPQGHSESSSPRISSSEQFDTNNVEWARLMRENKRLKSEAALNEKKVAILSQQVDDLRAEGTDLRKQLSSWQEKVSTISKRHSQERQKFENSSDLISKARVELTKTLNENSSLKTKLHELEMGADERDRRIRALNETVDNQSERISLMAAQLKDTEAELRYNVDEKRRVEEELAVLVASRDGVDVGETIRRLEREKAHWLEEKERALEAKRIALDEENDRMLDREKKRYRQEAEQLMEISEKSREREEEHKRLQQAINKQLKELKNSNEELRDKLQNEHLDNRVETKKKDHTIAMLEQEVSKLRRKLAASQLREQENEARLAEIDHASDELRYAKKHNQLLEKQIRKLKKEKQKRSSEDWKEIVLPGYKNLRGVTFGTPSEELAGFLTILVEDQKAKQSEALSKTQKEVIEKYLREYGRGDDRRGDTAVESKRSKKRNREEVKSSKKKSRVGVKKRKKNPNDFTDIEDYDWAVKPKKKKKKRNSSKQMIRDEQSSDEDSRFHAKAKRRKTHVKAKAKQKKKSRSGEKRTPKRLVKRRKKNSGGRRISRRTSLDENLAMMEKIDRKSKRQADVAESDDVSLVVMKRPHNREKAVDMKKKKKRPSQHRGRFDSVSPPAVIRLQ